MPTPTVYLLTPIKSTVIAPTTPEMAMAVILLPVAAREGQRPQRL